MGNVKVVFDLTASKIAVEGSEGDLARILIAAREVAPLFREVVVNRFDGAAKAAPVNVSGAPAEEPINRLAARDFVKQFTWKDSYRKIAALSYYLVKIEGRANFDIKQMETLFAFCGFRKPSDMSDQLVDAKRYHAFVEHNGQGKWTLGPGGERLILEFMETQKGKTAAAAAR